MKLFWHSKEHEDYVWENAEAGFNLPINIFFSIGERKRPFTEDLALPTSRLLNFPSSALPYY